MGKKNNVLAWYLNKPSVFADFCNGCLYEGEKTVLSEDLAEVQKANNEVMRDRNGKLLKKGRERDVVKLLHKNHHFVMIAVENQDKINYCMPLRCMEYDVADFVKQLRRLKNRHKEEGGLETAEEYFSGMKETDRLIPIVTILFYHEKGKWNAAMRLKDMLDSAGLDQRSLSMKKKAYRNSEKGGVDMCKAFDDLVKESEMRGEERGKKLGEKRGEEKLARLIEKLVQDGRMADILVASKNAQKRKRMYQEYGI